MGHKHGGKYGDDYAQSMQSAYAGSIEPTAATRTVSASSAYHPAYEKYLNAQRRKQQYQKPPSHNIHHHQFAFQPFSPANSRSMNVDNNKLPHHSYPSPIMSNNDPSISTHGSN